MKRPGGFDGRAQDDAAADPPVTPDARTRGRGAGARGGAGTREGAGGAGSQREAGPQREADPQREAGPQRPQQEAPRRPSVLDRLGPERGVGASAPLAGAPSGERASEPSNQPSSGPSNQPSDEPSSERASAPTYEPTRNPEDQNETQTLVPAGRSGGMLRLQREPREVDPVRAAERRLRAAERQNKRRRRRETKRFTAESRRVRRRALIAIATVLGLVLFVLLGALTPLMAVREVRVEGAVSVSAEDVTNALKEFEGVPLALVDENAVLRALEGFPLIQRFAVERVPPKTLIVRIEERVPAIAIEDDGVFRMYDAAGVLVAEAPERPEGVPAGGGGLRITSSKAFLAASKIVRDMPAGLRAQLVAVDASSGQDVTFQLASGVEVFWGNPEETKRKSLVLETMLGSLQERPVSHIDVSSTESPIFK